MNRPHTPDIHFNAMTRWTLTTLTVLLLTAWLASGRWAVLWSSGVLPSGVWREIVVARGCLFAGAGMKVGFGGFYHDPAVEFVDRFDYRGQRYALILRPDWRFTNTGRRVRIPLWIPTLVLALPAVLLWHSHINQRRRDRIGHCPNCNYDLTGLPTPDSNTKPTCPECGT